MDSRAKKTLFVLLKLAVSSVLLTLVLRKAGISNIIAHLREADVRYFVGAVAIQFVCLILAAFRWRLFLTDAVPFPRLVSLTLIGSFFNNLLPGAVGGDAVKMYYLYKDTRKGGSSVGAVIMDRYVGFFALLSIGLVSGLAAFSDLRAVGMHWVTPTIFLSFLAGSAVVFGLRIGRRFAAVADFHDYFHAALSRRGELGKAYLLSIAIQTLTILMIALVAWSIGQRPSFIALFVFVPVIIVLMAVPVSISGFGIRESAFALLFGLTGISAEAATTISFLWFLSIATASTTGLIEYLRYRKSLVPKDRT